MRCALAAQTPNPPCYKCNTQTDSFSFIEFRSIEECTNALCLDSIIFTGAGLNFKRGSKCKSRDADRANPSLPARAPWPAGCA